MITEITALLTLMQATKERLDIEETTLCRIKIQTQQLTTRIGSFQDKLSQVLPRWTKRILKK